MAAQIGFKSAFFRGLSTVIGGVLGLRKYWRKKMADSVTAAARAKKRRHPARQGAAQVADGQSLGRLADVEHRFYRDRQHAPPSSPVRRRCFVQSRDVFGSCSQVIHSGGGSFPPCGVRLFSDPPAAKKIFPARPTFIFNQTAFFVDRPASLGCAGFASRLAIATRALPFPRASFLSARRTCGSTPPPQKSRQFRTRPATEIR